MLLAALTGIDTARVCWAERDIQLHLTLRIQPEVPDMQLAQLLPSGITFLSWGRGANWDFVGDFLWDSGFS